MTQDEPDKSVVDKPVDKPAMPAWVVYLVHPLIGFGITTFELVHFIAAKRTGRVGDALVSGTGMILFFMVGLMQLYMWLLVKRGGKEDWLTTTIRIILGVMCFTLIAGNLLIPLLLIR